MTNSLWITLCCFPLCTLFPLSHGQDRNTTYDGVYVYNIVLTVICTFIGICNIIVIVIICLCCKKYWNGVPPDGHDRHDRHVVTSNDRGVNMNYNETLSMPPSNATPISMDSAGASNDNSANRLTTRQASLKKAGVAVSDNNTNRHDHGYQTVMDHGSPKSPCLPFQEMLEPPDDQMGGPNTNTTLKNQEPIYSTTSESSIYSKLQSSDIAKTSEYTQFTPYQSTNSCIKSKSTYAPKTTMANEKYSSLRTRDIGKLSEYSEFTPPPKTNSSTKPGSATQDPLIPLSLISSHSLHFPQPGDTTTTDGGGHAAVNTIFNACPGGHT